MERELLIEIGCEELPASWLRPLTELLSARLAARLTEFRLSTDAPVETYATPRRLTAAVARIAERQNDLEEMVSGPPVAAAFTADGQPTPAAIGFARKQGVDVGELTRQQTPRGEYLSFLKRQRGKTAVDVLPDVLAGTLRDLTFPKQMHWDAWLDDGRGELLFGRPIRWLLFLYGGRVVPFTIRRSSLASSGSVQEVRSGPTTYGHRFLAVSGRPGRAVKVRSFSDYRARLAEHFVILDRLERHNRIGRELDANARRLGGRVNAVAVAQTGLLEEVVDLIEYPCVVAGSFPAEFLDLPEEVLTTTMIHHQHYFPVVDDGGKLMPAFLAVTNVEVDTPRKIAVNAERVLQARLRDARFFWEADRSTPLEDKLSRLDTLLFHKNLGSYRAKAERLERLSAWVAREALGRPEAADAAALAGRLAKADLTTDMVREFTELQGTMGGIYARGSGHPASVWKPIYYQYLPLGVEAHLPPSREQLGEAAVSWAAVALADKLDSVVGLFSAGERPTGTRDPFGMRRQVQGIVKILVDLPEVTDLRVPLCVDRLMRRTAEELPGAVFDAFAPDLMAFVRDRLRHVFSARGYSQEQINAALVASDAELSPLRTRWRLEALQASRGSADVAGLAELFKRVKNIAREVSPQPQASYPLAFDRAALTEPAEQALLAEFDRRAPAIRKAIGAADYTRAMTEASLLRGAVDRFFTEVFVMVDDERVRHARLMLLVHLRDLILEIADISQLAGGA
ncbi:MAG: glycine--tRNA ligase subunit beta [Vicinamibacterales bacterium]